MNQENLERRLADLSLGAVHYFDRLGSTNDEARDWADQGAPDFSLVIADEQVTGRGRAGRAWITPPGAALAFSLVLYPHDEEKDALPRLTALGALGVCAALQDRFDLVAQIKWPNDVLLNQRKVAGILAEAHWRGNECTTVILGIGINVALDSARKAESAGGDLHYPATCVETELGRPVDRMSLLHHVLDRIIHWRPSLASSSFLRAWEAALAFRGEWVQLLSGERVENEGELIGLSPDGGLMLQTRSQGTITARAGELRLRPLEGRL